MKISGFLADSQVVDAAGRLLVMYHGSNVAIDVFTSRNDRDGIYFSSSAEYAIGYGEVKASVYGGNAALYPVYLVLRNPVILDNDNDADFEWYTQRGFVRQEVIAQGHDGVVLLHSDGEVEAMVFEAEQIQSAMDVSVTAEVVDEPDEYESPGP